MKITNTLLLLLLLTSSATAAHRAIIKQEFIFRKAPFPRCHAATIVESNGMLVVAWFGGKHEKNPDVGIWLSRKVRGRWSRPVEVVNGVQSETLRYPCWNPVLYQASKKRLLLFYKVGPSPRKWWGMLTESSDNGKTWSKPKRLPKDILGPIKNKPVMLPNGQLLCGSSTENQGWRVHFERTGDFGKTWKRTKALNDGRAIGAIQPTILLHDKGKRLQALGRSRQGRIWETWSSDGGVTWDDLKLINLPNPNAGFDAVTLRDQKLHLMVYNHTRRGRSPLNLAATVDGKKWYPALTLETARGEFSYPAIIQTSNGKVHIVYTHRRLRIKHVVIDPKRLRLKIR